MHSLDNLHDTHYQLAFLLPRFREVMTVVTVAVVLWELVFPLAIVSKVARRVILTFGVGFHLSTLFFMNIFFPYHVAAYAVFIDWPRFFARVKVGSLFQIFSRHRISWPPNAQAMRLSSRAR
jgi:hypothetical protein